MLWLTDIRLPAERRCVQRARSVVDASGLGLDVELREDLRLLISELATNAIRHGTPESAGGDTRIRIRLGLEGRSLRVEVHDRGPGFRHQPRGADAQLGSGWGVHFVHTLADRWGAGHDAAGTWVVWFEIELPTPHGDRGEMLYGQRAGDGLPLLSGAMPRDRSHDQDLASTG